MAADKAEAGEEMNDLLGPSEAKDGGILYLINDAYVEKDLIEEHLEKCLQREHFQAFVGTLKEYEKVFIGGGAVIYPMN